MQQKHIKNRTKTNSTWKTEKKLHKNHTNKMHN